MTKDERAQLEQMQRDIRGIKDDLHILVTNHLAHLQRSVDDLQDEIEQTYGVADEACKKASRTEKFVVASIAFFGLIMALIQSLG